MPLKVLVVDDNQDAAWSAAVILELAGCETRTCRDGPTALTAARDFSPDVCVLDLTMPGMDGLELARVLARQQAGRVRLIALTARGDEAALRQTREAGFERHLVKTIDPDLLIEAVTGQKPVLAS